jgi:hypothetical protein
LADTERGITRVKRICCFHRAGRYLHAAIAKGTERLIRSDIVPQHP